MKNVEKTQRLPGGDLLRVAIVDEMGMPGIEISVHRASAEGAETRLLSPDEFVEQREWIVASMAAGLVEAGVEATA